MIFSGNSSPKSVRSRSTHSDRERRVDSKESLQLVLVELSGPPHRREPRIEQDLVGVRVSDATENSRVGECPLQSAVLPQQSLPERGEVHFQRLDATRIERRQSFLTADHVERRPLACARFRQQEGSVGKIERRVTPLLGNGGTPLLPPQAACDHEVNDREKFPLQLEDNAFPHPAHGGQAPTFQLRNPRIEGPQQRRGTNAHGLDDLPENALLERTNVCGDLREFRHGLSIWE